MYEKDGEKYYVVDAHVHIWDGRSAFAGCDAK